jgi:para-aminobenzoate synthetase/4-amino-4-deoxychorismate lyase
VFETLLVTDARPVALERHLARLSGSVQALYGHSLPVGLAEELLAAAAVLERARMRVDVRPGEHGIEVRHELTGVYERELPVRLVPTALPGGLGAHKWSDRRLLSALGGDGEPLLCDLDGLVLETARANVFAVNEHGALVTPPADGRILPGVTRGQVLELARRFGLEVYVRPIALGELAYASELFLTGSLGGVEAAHLDGEPGAAGPVTARLAGALASLELAPA